MRESDPLDPLSGRVRDWFRTTFPAGPTPAQVMAWPRIAEDRHTLLISPTGTGKTLAAFLAIIDRLLREAEAGPIAPGLRCVYLSPLKSLGRDVERNLALPLDEIRASAGWEKSPIRVGVRSGDTSPHARKKLRDDPPHLLITTPESLSLLLSQANWRDRWANVRHVIVDEVHSMVSTKRGADLALSLERLCSLTKIDPCRVGLSATCRPAELVGRFLVGPDRTCEVLEAPPPPGSAETSIQVESLIRDDEAPDRGLTYRRLLRRLNQAILAHRTTLIFANTRAFTEKLTHDLRLSKTLAPESIAAHHGSLDAQRRHEVEAGLKSGELRAVVTSTSLELGVDIGHADLAVLVGLPGSTSRCLQRIGRAGHRPDASTQGLLLAATPAELIGAAVTAEAARERRIEPQRLVDNPLDVLCQGLIGLACLGEHTVDDVFAMVRRSASFADLSRIDFDACLSFLAGDLAAPPGAFEPAPGAAPRWTSPRIWRVKGLFGIRNKRVVRWFWSNVGTIVSEESTAVIVDDKPIGRLEASYAERLQPGDRFVLDGRGLECRRTDGNTLHARQSAGEPNLPRWSSDRQGLSAELALDVAKFRRDAADLLDEGASSLRDWLDEAYGLDTRSAGVVEALIQAQEAASEVPKLDTLLVEWFPDPETGDPSLAFHVPLGRAACEALGRAVGARLGRGFGQDLALSVADLGWTIRLPQDSQFTKLQLENLFNSEFLEADVLDGLDRGELQALRFRHVAATALMVLRNPEGGRVKVGGLLWVSRRLFPLVKAACPDHPLLRETRREVLNDLLDVRSVRTWLATRPTVRYRVLDRPSPFTLAWIIGASAGESLKFETRDDALRRLHARLVGGEAADG